MKVLSVLFNILKHCIKRIQRSIELSRYNDYTITEYFRKQGAKIGEGCYIIPRDLGTEPYLVKIGNRVAIAEGVKFLTHDGGVWIFRKEDPNIQVFGPIIIEDNCIIGQNAILFPNIRIGANSIIGAGSIVITDVPPNSIVMGVPARVFGSVEKYKEKSFARWKQQMPPGCIIEEGADWWHSKNMEANREKLKKHLLKLFSEEYKKETKQEVNDQ